MPKILEKYKKMPLPIKASLWFLVCSVMQKGISVVITPIFTRIMNTAEYGQYSVFNSWLGVITIFVTLELFQGVYAQGVVKFEEDRNVFSSALQGLLLCLVFFWTVVYCLFHDFWNNLFSLTTVQMLAMLVIIWATGVFGFWATEQRVDFKYRHLVLLTIIISIMKPAVGIVFVVFADDKVTARILGIALVELIAYTGLFFAQIKRGRRLFSAKYWKYALAFNIPLVPHYLATTILSSSDRIMIGSIVGSSEAGIYNLAYSISLIMTMVNTALNQTLGPWIYKKIKSKTTSDIAGVAYSSLLIIAFANLFLIAFAPEAVKIFAPPSYYEAIWIVPPVAMSVYFIFTYSLFSKFAFYYERTKLVACATVCCAVLNLFLNAVFIRMYGYIAAGYTTLICYMLFSIFHYVCMIKTCDNKMDGVRVYSTKVVLCISSGFMFLGFLFLMVYEHTLIRFSMIGLLLVGLFVKRMKMVSLMKKIISLKKFG